MKSIKDFIKESYSHNANKELNDQAIKEGGIHGMETQIPKAILDDIEENFDKSSVSPMDSSWYVVGINGKYGNYEIDIPANGHCRIKMYRYNSHGNSEDDQWYYHSTEWFDYCENRD